MHQYLPSKKFLYTIGSIIVAILLVWGVAILTERQSIVNQAKKSAELAQAKQKDITFQQFMAIDSDSDGLKDWEETLWKTDSKKADTDGDGTTDGDEVKINRDPTKPSPGDEIDPKTIANNQKSEEEFNKLTPTEQFSRIFFSQYIDAKNSSGGSTLTNSDKQIILDGMISEVSKTKIITKYDISNIKITKDTSSTTIKNYGNGFGIIFMDKPGTETGKELLYLAQATTNQDEKILSKLDPIIKEYEQNIIALIGLLTPETIAPLHLSIINNIENIKISVEGMKKIFSDPLTAIISIQTYRTTATSLFNNLDALNQYFVDNKVFFSSTEPGIIISGFKK